MHNSQPVTRYIVILRVQKNYKKVKGIFCCLNQNLLDKSIDKSISQKSSIRNRELYIGFDEIIISYF